MKRNKLITVLTVILLLTCVVLCATACNQPKKYTANFIFKNLPSDQNANNIFSFTKEAGEELTPPTAQNYEGKRFKGWFLDENGTGDPVTPPTVMPNKNVTYYGVYEDIDTTVYTLTFIIDGKTIGSVSGISDSTITAPTAPKKAGYKFNGWFDENNDPVPSTMPANNVTYYGSYSKDLNPQVPDDYNMAFACNDGDAVLYLAGEDVYLDRNGKIAISILSRDGDTAEFTIDDKDYCAFLDYDEATFGLYEYAFDKNTYVLYLPISDSFDFERCLSFENDGKNFKIMGYTYDTLWAKGDCEAIVSAYEEFELTVTENNAYNQFGDCRIKLTKRVRQNEDTGAKPVAYSAFMIFDQAMYGNYTHNSNDSIKLALDGYGFGTYTYANGSVAQGVCETAEVDLFQDNFINFTNLKTGEESLILLIGSNSFAPIGKEIGLYRVFDSIEQLAGSYYMLIDGMGNIDVYYGKDIAYNPEELVASGSYTINNNGEFIYTMTEMVQENLLTDIYKTTFRFKLTTYGSGLYVTKAFAVYNEALAGVYANEAGTETITLDGYGNATHVKGNEKFTGTVQIDNDLLLITSADESQRIYRITTSNTQNLFRQIGIEYGYYISYSYLTGMSNISIYFDGEGKAIEYDITNADSPVALRTGTYLMTDKDGEYIVTFGSAEIKIALRQMNFGSLQEPLWYSVFIRHNADWDITLRNSALNETLVLDGYGLDAVYTDATGAVWHGEFVWEWKLITLLALGEDDYKVLIFNVDGQTFELKTNEAGVYYSYIKEAAVSTDNVRILLDGNGNGLYSVYDNENDAYANLEGTYTYNEEKKEYTFTAQNQAPVSFILAERNFVTVFIVYDENWAGEYVNDYEYKLVLDGYGNVWYRDEESTAVCQVFGTNHEGVTFTLNGESYAMILNKSRHTFERTMDPLGYYYLFEFDTVRGRTRVCINPDNTATLQEYSDEQSCYLTTASGTLTNGVGENVFVFSSATINFTFKVDVVGGYDVYRVQDEFAATLTCTDTVVPEEAQSRLVLNGFGDAEYIFYDAEEERERTFEGYYTIDGNTLTFIAIGTNGMPYYTYVMEVDFEANTFKTISKE